MQLPIKVARNDLGSRIEVDAYDDGVDRYVTIVQPVTQNSVSFDHIHIDALIDALTMLKQGFKSGWEQPEDQKELT